MAEQPATTETTEKTTETETAKAPETFKVSFSLQALLDNLIDGVDFWTDADYSDAVSWVYKSKQFSDAQTFPLLLRALRRGSLERVSKILSLGQNSFDASGQLFLYSGTTVFSAMYSGAGATGSIIAAMMEDLLLKNSIEAIRAAFIGNCRFDSFANIAGTQDPVHYSIAKDFFLKVGMIPHSASPKMLIECGEKGVYYRGSKDLVIHVLDLIAGLRTELATVSQDNADLQKKISAVSEIISKFTN